MSRDRLQVICTNRGKHPRRDLGMILWTPEAVHRDGFAVWDAKGDQSVHTPAALSVTGRETRAGKWRTTERGTVTTATRKDGGLTFTFPACPKCRRPPTPLRDTTLGELLRAELPEVDVSKLP